MLYKFIAELATIAFVILSCDDETKTESPEEHQGITVSIVGEEIYMYKWCGRDYVPVFSATASVVDTFRRPIPNFPIELIDVPAGFEFLPINDSIHRTNDSGNVNLQFTCQCFGPFAFVVTAGGDTDRMEFQISQQENIFGVSMDPQEDTLVDTPNILDTLEIRAQLIYDWGFPSATDSTKFTASAGLVDTTFRDFGYLGGGRISVYWTQTNETPYGQIMIYALTKTDCGVWPNDMHEILLHDTTSFLFAPSP